ncbi:MAG: hypothetical protein K5879_05055 [Lachnospiraceae bacterium]|nr:hypothetical protein [Lachnospiraceae bacterium]
MFTCDYKKLILSFNEFHNIEPGEMPQYGEFCMIELKDGRYTGGEWNPSDYDNKKSVAGGFVRGTGDSVSSGEVARWHSLGRYNASNCLEQEDMDLINFGVPGENVYSVRFDGFKSFDDGDFPKSEQYCLLILKNGRLSSGRWERYNENDGAFIYAPALASHSMNKVWAWTPLSPDSTFEAEEEYENERKREEELNQNPSTDSGMFRYGTDIDVYYEKALEKLLEKYPWATVTQMKKTTPWEIVPHHGKYVFGKTSEGYRGETLVEEWEGGMTAEEFIDFLCEYTKEVVENSDPGKKFKFGTDVEVYLEKAYKNVRKEYHWINKKMIKSRVRYDIRKIDGDLEFVRAFNGSGEYHVLEYGSAEEFIECIERDYQEVALSENPVTATYDVPFGRVEIHGWYLERYRFVKMQSGDYKVEVQAGDRVTGGNRTFFITPECFEADTYEAFLDRYLQIVPGESFGLSKKELLQNRELKKFLGYRS